MAEWIMNKFLLLKKYFILMLLPLYFFIRCVSPTAGGETLNEKVVYMCDGVTPAESTIVSFGPIRKDSIVHSEITDSNGIFKVPALSADTYSVFLSKTTFDGNSLVSLQNNVFISPDTNTVVDDTLSKPGIIKGVIQFPYFHNTSDNLLGVIVNIQGIQKFTNVDSAGNFRFDNIAKDACYDIKIDPKLSGYRMEFINDCFSTGSDKLVLDTVYLQYNSVPPVTINSIVYDSINGVVTINWDPLQRDDIAYYEVFRERGSKRISLGEKTDTFSFDDTLFSISGDDRRHPVTDTACYNYTYRVSAVTNDYRQSLLYRNPADTISVKSPQTLSSNIQFELSDSATADSLQGELPYTIKGNTVRIVTTLKNRLLPIYGWRYTTIEGDLLKKVNVDSSGYEFADTIYVLCPDTGKITLNLDVLDEFGNIRPYSTKSVSFYVYDPIFYIKNIKMPDIYFPDNVFDGCIEIVNENQNLVPHLDLKIDYYLNEEYVGNIYKKVENDTLINVEFDINEIGSEVTIPEGNCTLKVVVTDVRKSQDFEAVFTREIVVSDLDLEIIEVVFSEEDLYEGVEVKFGVKIKNSGTTPFFPQVDKLVRVDFDLNQGFQFWGFIQDTIVSGDTVLVFGEYSRGNASWEASAGKHYLKVIIDSNKITVDKNQDNNETGKEFYVHDFNIGVKKFTAVLNNSLDTLQYSLQVFSGGEFRLDHPNEIIDSVKVLLMINGVEDSTFYISMDNFKSGQNYNFSAKKYIDICKSDENEAFVYDSLVPGVVIDPENELFETDKFDNTATLEIKKTIIDVNGTFLPDKDNADIVSGWESCVHVVEEGKSVSNFHEYMRPGQRTADNHSLYITSDVGVYASWCVPHGTAKPDFIGGKSYVIKFYARIDDDLKRVDGGTLPIVHAGFDELGSLSQIAVDPESFESDDVKKRFGWKRFAGIITLPSGVLDTYTLSLSLGNYTDGNKTNLARGGVTFDNIQVETFDSE